MTTFGLQVVLGAVALAAVWEAGRAMPPRMLPQLFPRAGRFIGPPASERQFRVHGGFRKTGSLEFGSEHSHGKNLGTFNGGNVMYGFHVNYGGHGGYKHFINERLGRYLTKPINKYVEGNFKNFHDRLRIRFPRYVLRAYRFE